MPATLQRYADRQNIHAIGGVVGDLGDGLADDGRKVGLVRIEAQLSAAPDIGHMMQAVLAAVGSGQHYAVDLVGAGGETDPGNVAGAALQRWHGVFCGGLQRDDGAGCGTGVTVGGLESKISFGVSEMPELLDRDDRRAYYFGRRTAEKRIFIEQKVSII